VVDRVFRAEAALEEALDQLAVADDALEGRRPPVVRPDRDLGLDVGLGLQPPELRRNVLRLEDLDLLAVVGPDDARPVVLFLGLAGGRLPVRGRLVPAGGVLLRSDGGRQEEREEEACSACHGLSPIGSGTRPLPPPLSGLDRLR